MMVPSALTEGGLLYEGSDFEQWEKDLRRRLRAEDLEHMLGPVPLTREASDEERRLACDILRLHISGGLRARIQSPLPEPRPHPLPRLNLLRRLAKPFCLMDLPPELRVRIYEYAMPNDHTIEIAPMRSLVTGYLPIIAVSRQVRAEALPVLYSQSVLTLKLHKGSASIKEMPIFEEEERVFDFAKGIKACERHLHREQLRHLRKVKVLFSFPLKNPHRCYKRWVQWMTLTFSPSQGLQIPPIVRSQSIVNRDGVLSAESRTKFEDHIKKTEEMRSALGLQGESILLALTSDESLWEEGVMYMD